VKRPEKEEKKVKKLRGRAGPNAPGTTALTPLQFDTRCWHEAVCVPACFPLWMCVCLCVVCCVFFVSVADTEWLAVVFGIYYSDVTIAAQE
jgi:hypothetical protein